MAVGVISQVYNGRQYLLCLAYAVMHVSGVTIIPSALSATT
jgi:hypothetical protein